MPPKDSERRREHDQGVAVLTERVTNMLNTLDQDRIDRHLESERANARMDKFEESLHDQSHKVAANTSGRHRARWFIGSTYIGLLTIAAAWITTRFTTGGP